MARSLEEFDPQTLSRPDHLLDPRRLERSAARAIALAISSLLVTTLVVTTSVSALEPEGTMAGNSFEAGTIQLLEGDQGRSTVSLADMAPGRPVVECITVRYTGSIVPVDLNITASADGPPANNLWVEVELGSGGGFGSCGGFRPATTVLTGTFADIVEQESMTVASLINTQEAVTFRFRFDVLDDDRAKGIATAADFVWEVVPR